MIKVTICVCRAILINCRLCLKANTKSKGIRIFIFVFFWYSIDKFLLKWFEMARKRYRPPNHQQNFPSNDAVIMNVAQSVKRKHFESIHLIVLTLVCICHLSKWLTVINSCPFYHYFDFCFSFTMVKTFISPVFFKANRSNHFIWFVTYWMQMEIKLLYKKIMKNKKCELHIFRSVHVHHIQGTHSLRLHNNQKFAEIILYEYEYDSDKIDQVKKIHVLHNTYNRIICFWTFKHIAQNNTRKISVRP